MSEKIELTSMQKGEIAAQTGKIQALCALITMETSHNVFCEYSAHVETFEVKWYDKGWTASKESINSEVYTKTATWRSFDTIMSDLKELETVILEMAKGKIKTSDLPYEIEEVKRYSLI